MAATPTPRFADSPLSLLRNIVSLPVRLPMRAGQAVVNSVSRLRRRRLNSQRGEVKVPLLLQEREGSRCALEDFHTKRAWAWTKPQRALETLEPWAELKICIDQAQGFPCEGVQPFLEIFVNDDLKHSGIHNRQAWSSKRPFEASVGIHSPLSIVRIMVMDETAENDFVGFVELCVADLTPNAAEAVSGWFELRLPWRLLGTGRARHRAHARISDEQAMREERSAGEKAGRRAGRREPANAGKIHIFLRLVATDNPDDEWYAFCLPRPVFTIFHRFSEADDKINPLDVMDLWRDIWAIKQLIWDIFIRHAVSIATYITHWQFPPLSAAVLAWWLTISWLPRWFFPTLPLWVAFWIRLLRAPSWKKEVLAHQATATLDAEGYRMVARLGNTHRVAFWLERVVRDQGGQVLSLKALDKFAALIYRDRKPLFNFDELLESLHKEPCIKWPKLTAPLNASGLRLVQESENVRWATAWLSQVIESRDGLVQDQNRFQRFVEVFLSTTHAEGPRAWDDLLTVLRSKSWIVWRDYGLGEATGGPNDAGWWARIPSWMIPRPVERLAYRLANPVEDLRKSLAGWCRWGAVVFEDQGAALAAKLYARCATMFALLSLATWHLDVSKLLWTVVGIAVATHRLPGVRQALTARRATSDLFECRGRREDGGCYRWAFCEPTPGWVYPEGACDPPPTVLHSTLPVGK